MSDDFFVEIESSVARVTLDREQRRNALTRAMLVGLAQEFKKLAENPEVRLIEIAAKGSVFCAGMDLGEMKDRAEESGPEDWLQDSLVYRDLLLAIVEAPQPVVAIIQGPVLAGGVGVVLACDLVLATQDVFLSLPEPQRGITASMVTPLLLRKVGVGHAGHLLLGGQRIEVQQMCGWGICQSVVESSELRDEVIRWRDEILKGSRQALASTKKQLLQFAGDVRGQLSEAAKLSAQARATEDAQEGLAAFLEKRKPNWQM